MKPSHKQFGRVLNALADTIIDLQLLYDGTPQPLRVVALDGVPTGSQDGTSRGKSVTETDILLAPAARAEFIKTGPSANVQNATLMALNVDTGPAWRQCSHAADREHDDVGEHGRCCDIVLYLAISLKIMIVDP
jgi:hypothetical protein